MLGYCVLAIPIETKPVTRNPKLETVNVDAERAKLFTDHAAVVDSAWAFLSH